MELRRFIAITLAFVPAVVACGSEGETAYELELVPPSLAIDSTDIWFASPWSPARVVRDPVPDSPAVVVRGVGTSEEDGLTRVVFEFQETGHYPGYLAEFADEAPIRCGTSATDPQLGGDRFLVVKLEPTRLTGTPPVLTSGPVEAVGHARMPEAAVACADADGLTWAAAVRDVGEIRVVELRDPWRLAVEVR